MGKLTTRITNIFVGQVSEQLKALYRDTRVKYFLKHNERRIQSGIFNNKSTESKPSLQSDLKDMKINLIVSGRNFLSMEGMS